MAVTKKKASVKKAVKKAVKKTVKVKPKPKAVKKANITVSEKKQDNYTGERPAAAGGTVLTVSVHELSELVTHMKNSVTVLDTMIKRIVEEFEHKFKPEDTSSFHDGVGSADNAFNERLSDISGHEAEVPSNPVDVEAEAGSSSDILEHEAKPEDVVPSNHVDVETEAGSPEVFTDWMPADVSDFYERLDNVLGKIVEVRRDKDLEIFNGKLEKVHDRHYIKSSKDKARFTIFIDKENIREWRVPKTPTECCEGKSVTLDITKGETVVLPENNDSDIPANIPTECCEEKSVTLDVTKGETIVLPENDDGGVLVRLIDNSADWSI